MVLLAAVICTKSGKTLLSRQFVEMTKARIETLIAVFPKLLAEGKQHTFVETESVRYVYQPLEHLYILLITTKASNILEDLETLRLFARVIPEYACGTDETDILNNAFQLIFAFDEIISLGYREDVNLSLIRNYMEMDSHEERVYRALQETKERDAKEVMKKHARDLQQARLEAAKRGVSSATGIGRSFKPDGIGSGFTGFDDEPRVVSSRDSLNDLPESTSRTAPLSNQAVSVKPGGMKLGSKQTEARVDQFVDQLRAEGVPVSDQKIDEKRADSDVVKRVHAPNRAPVHKESLHLRIEERLTVQADRNGGLESMELLGILYALSSTQETSEARIRVDTSKLDERQLPVQLQTHPCLDKKVFTSSNWLQTKSNGKAFPVNQEVSLLRWRMQTQDESSLPITVNCWPNEIRGGFEVNIEYELVDSELDLQDVVITIPLPAGSKTPVVNNCDGDYDLASGRSQLVWTLPPVNAKNSTGSMEFTLGSEPGAKSDHFFPLRVAFSADRSFVGIRPTEAVDSSKSALNFSCEATLNTEKYEIV